MSVPGEVRVDMNKIEFRAVERERDRQIFNTNLEASCPRMWNKNQLRKYDMTFDPIPRLSYDDPRVDELMTENVSCLVYIIIALFNDYVQFVRLIMSASPLFMFLINFFKLVKTNLKKYIVSGLNDHF